MNIITKCKLIVKEKEKSWDGTNKYLFVITNELLLFFVANKAPMMILKRTFHIFLEKFGKHFKTQHSGHFSDRKWLQTDLLVVQKVRFACPILGGFLARDKVFTSWSLWPNVQKPEGGICS